MSSQQSQVIFVLEKSSIQLLKEYSRKSVYSISPNKTKTLYTLIRLQAPYS